MIKANEIKVNNYFKYVGNSSFAKTQGLFKWDETDWFKLLDESFSLEDVELIPLTEEWLLKFGFSAESYYDNFKIKDFEISSSIRVISTNERKCFYLCLTEDSVFNIKIDYVHQLQNLYFSLTNEELTLKD